MSIPEFLHYTEQEIKSLAALAKKSPYELGDIRKDHFLYLADIFSVHQRGVTGFEISKIISEENIAHNSKYESLRKYINEYGSISRDIKYSQSHRNQVNRSLIIDSWSQFEFSITTLCNKVLTQAEIETLLGEKYDEIVKIVGMEGLDDAKQRKLEKKLFAKHLSHISITRKCDKLFKYCKNYSRDISKDKDFLLFFGRIRNTMHSTYIFFGNDAEYIFSGITTVFENGKPVYHRQPIGLKFYFDLAVELTNVFSAIISSIDYRRKIDYPTMEDS